MNSHDLRQKLQPQYRDLLYFTFKPALTFIKECIDNQKSFVKVLDVGCGQKPYRSLFPENIEYIGLDIDPKSKADIICNNWNIPFPDNYFDCILSTFVLEHTLELEASIQEMYRVLKKNGIVILIIPFTFPLHEIPHDYWRFTRYSLEHLFSKFKIKKLIASDGYLLTLAVFINIQFMLAVKNKFLQQLFFFVTNHFAQIADALYRIVLNHKAPEIDKLNRGYYSLPLNYHVLLTKPNEK